MTEKCQKIFLMMERKAAERNLKSNQIKKILSSKIAISEISFPFNFLLKRAIIPFLFLLVLLVFLHGRFGAAAKVAVQDTFAVSCFNFTQSFFITPIIFDNRGRKFLKVTQGSRGAITRCPLPANKSQSREIGSANDPWTMTVKSAEQTNLYYVALHLWQRHFHGSYWKAVKRRDSQGHNKE